MQTYLDLCKDVLENGADKGDRTGTGTRSLFGRQIRFDLSKGFPAMTTKKLAWKSVVVELLWFLAGDTNIGYLLENGVHIWDEWTPAFKNGGKARIAQLQAELPNLMPHQKFADLELGPVYGHQWRAFGQRAVDHSGNNAIEFSGLDQIKQIVQRIKDKPDDRRLIVTAWNPLEVDKCGLPPCHCFFQFYVVNGKLSCQMYQRSADLFLGVPFNIASYALLTHMVAHVCKLEVGEFVHTFGDVHIYNNHFDQIKEQMQREPYPLPNLWLNWEVDDIFKFTLDDIKLYDYQSHGTIKAPVAV